MRAISTSQAVLTALRERNRAQSRRSSDTSLIVPPSDTPTLQTVDYTARLPDKEYDEQLAEWQSRLARLAQHDKFRDRSEEHTSELQSLMRISYAVFCLKKKMSKKIKQPQTNTRHNAINNN